MYKIIYEDEFGSPYTLSISDKELHSTLKNLIEKGFYICYVEPIA